MCGHVQVGLVGGFERFGLEASTLFLAFEDLKEVKE
jgi:hypothetical protein